MKKYIMFAFILLVMVSGCSYSDSNATIEVYDFELQRVAQYQTDEENNIIFINNYKSENDYTVKISPPKDLKDLSEVRIWFNEIPFTNSDMFFSNGKEIYITLPKDKRLTSKVTIQWMFNSKKQDYFITYN